MRLSQAVITQSVRAFPILSSTAIVLPLGNVIGSILYPFGVSFLMPLFVVSLVKEKERKIVAMMKINGVKTWIYSLSQFATFLVIYCISALVFVISGFAFKLQVFLVTSPSVLFILFFVWGLTQISMSFLIASACRSSNMALSFSFLLVLSSVVASMSLNTLYPFDSALPGYFLAWPPFAFIRALAVINQASYISSYTLQKLSGSDQVLWCIYYLLIESLIMQLISAYLETIIPSPLGVTYPWHWPLSSLFPPNKVKPQSDKDSIDKRPSMASIDIELDNDEGSDVVQERQRVALSKDVLMKRCPLVIHELRKKYPGLDTACKQQREIKMALNGISFAVEQGVVFGLLGPNGAGKSTLMSILTRVNKPTSGGAWIDGFSLDQIDEVQTRIGLCPQDDILWDDLTVFEHLLFYSRLKGVSNTDQTQYVEKLMTDVKLKHLADRTTRHLSGGEKRRLSIAIALVGSSKLIFLDEPTTGLDPDVRRQIWAIMKEAKKGKTIILTTHSMEEADVCCNRIGIMLKGNLKCIGPHIRLKQMHGNGFRLSFAVLSSYDVLSARSLVEPILPDNRVLISSLNSHHIYEFLPEKGDVLKIMSVLEEKAATYGIIDWEITQTTLENLFMKLVAKDEAS
ncbi:P-loop containing nucleoside triphosphate hydrolase protein [Rhizoclosmatium globosum]|uniref:p-loop containing nucleoside triphosphate hydrolase protein n=1 Tax=Rhizoclosmatium globosum TaxID=329046 RepID=A0A1Y2D0X6_9FUNG|nr:P-loop containing nucleoside triphosphate hydrolase protein [Rhizoclosmatium globosum]|eukprot:ORY52928.1 P-loop containing nucleoside triphosphate hydrolase protein [Rhizoclosmatium globosum]